MLPQRLTVKKGEEVFDISPTGVKTSIAKGGEELHKVGNNLVRDNGTVVYEGKGEPLKVGDYLLTPEGKVIFKAPKEYAPHAPQLIETGDGFVQFNPNNGSVTPVKSPTGEPLMGNKPLTGEAEKRVVGAMGFQDAIDDYRKVLANFTPSDMASPEKRAILNTKYNTVLLQGKEANNLGVLNGGDERILKSLIPNPNDISTITISKNNLDKFAVDQKNFAGNIIKNVYEVNKKTIPKSMQERLQTNSEIIPKPSTKIPKGFTQAEWDVLTPKEKNEVLK
jgi:hypothetical protein